jgi:tRNA pseudouridine55 synthase
VPPMYSALKQGGQPLYRLARALRTVERAPRAIELYELTLVGLEPGSLELETSCSKGTYVRVLAEEIAEALGTVGHVSALRRLEVEPFGAEPMQTLESLERTCAAGGTAPLLPSDYPLRHLPAVHLTAADAARLRKGQAVPAVVPADPARADAAPDYAPRLRLYDDAGRFLGVGVAAGAGAVRPRRLLNN